MLAQPTIAMACSVVLIPFIPIVVGIMYYFLDRYLARLKCTLTERNLEIKKGLLNRVEQTIPLEKITDLQMFQGPIMRWMGLQGFRVETAGQSSGATGYLMNMVGIVDTPGFRAAVLARRDELAGATPPAPSAESTDTILRDIRDSLGRIESRLQQDPGASR